MVEPQQMTGGGGNLCKIGKKQWTMRRTKARSTNVGSIDGAGILGRK